MESELRRIRKALDLSQDDVAFLLGNGITGSMVSRHENDVRQPNLPVLLGYRMILGREISTLFADLDAHTSHHIKGRAHELISGLSRKPLTPKVQRQFAALRSIIKRLES